MSESLSKSRWWTIDMGTVHPDADRVALCGPVSQLAIALAPSVEWSVEGRFLRATIMWRAAPVEREIVAPEPPAVPRLRRDPRQLVAFFVFAIAAGLFLGSTLRLARAHEDLWAIVAMSVALVAANFAWRNEP